jgi:hypothetical protein
MNQHAEHYRPAFSPANGCWVARPSRVSTRAQSREIHQTSNIQRTRDYLVSGCARPREIAGTASSNFWERIYDASRGYNRAPMKTRMVVVTRMTA